MAPVLPALTTASTFFSAKSCQQRLIELSGFCRSATTGLSSMPIVCVQCKMSMRPRTAASAAQVRFHLGPIAHQGHAQIRIGGNGLHSARHHRSRCVVAAHRVQRDLHGLLLLFRLHRFAALVVAAVGTDAVRQHRLVALGAILDLQRFDVQMASPLALPGVRSSSLGNSHDSLAFAGSFRSKACYGRKGMRQRQVVMGRWGTISKRLL